MQSLSALALTATLFGMPSQPPPAYADVSPRPTTLDSGQDFLQRSSRRYLVPTALVSAVEMPFFFSGAGLAVLRDTGMMAKMPFAKQLDAFLDFNRWHRPSGALWRANLTRAIRWPDGDDLFMNYVIHPAVGFQIHLLYRNHGASLWEAIGLVVLWALFWEYVAEAGFEAPSGNDLVANFAGGLMGEAAYRAKTLIRDQMTPGMMRTVLVTLIDPFDAMETLALEMAETHAGGAPVVRWLR